MNGKERVHAALAGKATDRNAVTSLYNFLYYRDHFAELSGEPQWRMWPWLYSEPETYLRTFRALVEQAPFETLQPEPAPPRQVREAVSFTVHDGVLLRHDARDGSTVRMHAPVSGHAFDDTPNETRYVYDKADIDERVVATPAEVCLARGDNDYLDAVIAAMGKDHFIISGGVIGTLYGCSWHVGLTNLFTLLVDQPGLIDYLCQRQLEQAIEAIRTLAAAGGDAIYIDDATATSDMISVRHYERFSLPYVQEMVREIHRLGHKAILIYFGGVADRLDQIASIGADGLQMEATMKNYINDVGESAERIGKHVTLFGNLDPIATLQNASDAALEAEMQRQAEAGRCARGFIMSTGSPITPLTPLSRVRRFLELGRALR